MERLQPKLPLGADPLFALLSGTFLATQFPLELTEFGVIVRASDD